MVDLVARNDRSLRLLQSSHDFLSVSDLSVESFHLVVIVGSCEGDLSDVVSCCVEAVGSVLSHVRIMVGG